MPSSGRDTFNLCGYVSFCGSQGAPTPAVARGLVEWSLPIAQRGAGAKHYPYEPKEARCLLADAGFPKGFKTQNVYELNQVSLPLVNSFTFHGQGVGCGTNTLSAYRGERLVQTVEDMLCIDDVGQAMTVEIDQQG